MIFRRFFAYLIDMFIITILLLVILISIRVFTELDAITAVINCFTVPEDHKAPDITILVAIISFIMSNFYFSYFDSSKMGTPGKRILGIKVIDIFDGDALDGTTALLRFIARALINVTIIGFAVSVITMLCRKDGKMLHDILLSTRVVKR